MSLGWQPPAVRTAAQQLGDEAERAVAEALSGQGWEVLARNVHIGRNEIDLLATDPGPPRELVVVEVRWRARRDFGLPEETVDGRKWARLRAAAHQLRETGLPPDGRPLPPLPLRIDLVVVEPRRPIRHHRGVG